MAPTICAENEAVARDRFRKNRIGQHQQDNHHHTSGILNGGKITHRRTISSRNAFSKLNSFRIPDSESSNDTTDSQSMKSIENEISNNNNKIDGSPSSRTSMEIDDENYNDEDLSSLTSERLSCSKEAYCSNFRNVKHNHHHNRNFPIFNNKIQSPKSIVKIVPATSSTPSPASYLDLNDDSTISSSYSATTTFSSSKPLDLDQMIANVTKFPQRKGNTKKLLEIAVKTIKLIKRNQLLQKKLAQLQFETRVFIESVMSNPENQAAVIRHKGETNTNTTPSSTSPALQSSTTTIIKSSPTKIES